MRPPNYLTALLLAPLLSMYVQAQRPSTLPGKLNEYLISAHQTNRFNGVALVAHKGKVVLHQAYGVRNAQTKAPNDTSTRFPILSLTKSFTATLILQLQEQGKLSVDDKLRKYLPDLPSGEKIRLHHLLTHTSGLFNYTQLIGEEDSVLVSHPVPRQRVLDLFGHKPLEFKPGQQYAYNNSGYFLLGLVIEKVTGKPYEQVVRELIFQPLGMSRSGFDFINLPSPSRAFGYDTLTPTYYSPYPHYDSTVMASAGAIYSTTGDLFKWGRAVAGRQLLSAKSWKQALTPELNQYGYGWKLGDYLGKGYVRHDGGYPGFMAEFVHYPGEDLTIILLNNFGTYDDSLFPIVMGLSAIALNKPYDLWPPRGSNPIQTAEALSPYVGSYALNSEFGVDIVIREGRLVALGKGKTQFGELKLQAGDADTFFVGVFNSLITFQKDLAGKVTKFALREGGQQTEWKRTY